MAGSARAIPNMIASTYHSPTLMLAATKSNLSGELCTASVMRSGDLEVAEVYSTQAIVDLGFQKDLPAPGEAS